MTAPIRKTHSKDLRRGRFSETNRIYLITTVTSGRKKLFADWILGRILVHTLRGEEARAETFAFVIMPDHLHWLMQLKPGCELGDVVGSVKSVSAHRINKQTQGRGKVWQEGFYDHALRKEEDLKSVARYIVANPLRAKTVNSLADYPLWDAVWIE